MNVNVSVQYDKPQEGGMSEPLTFHEIKSLRETVNAPPYATIQFEEESYGWEIGIHWNTDSSKR